MITWGLRLVKVVAVLAFVFLAVGYTTASTGEQSGSVVRSNLDGQAVRLSLPSGDGEPKGIALWFHGQGGGANHRVESPWLDALRRDGWVIASSDFHETSWGNEASTEDTRRLIEWAEDEDRPRRRAVGLGLHGRRGQPQRPPVRGRGAAVLVRREARDQPDPDGQRARRAASSSRAPTTAPCPPSATRCATSTPLPLDTAYRVVASKDDHWVLYDQNTEPLIDTLVERGADVSLLPARGLHEDESHWDAPDLLDFADTCLDRETALASD